MFSNLFQKKKPPATTPKIEAMAIIDPLHDIGYVSTGPYSSTSDILFSSPLQELKNKESIPHVLQMKYPPSLIVQCLEVVYQQDKQAFDAILRRSLGRTSSDPSYSSLTSRELSKQAVASCISNLPEATGKLSAEELPSAYGFPDDPLYPTSTDYVLLESKLETSQTLLTAPSQSIDDTTHKHHQFMQALETLALNQQDELSTNDVRRLMQTVYGVSELSTLAFANYIHTCSTMVNAKDDMSLLLSNIAALKDPAINGNIRNIYSVTLTTNSTFDTMTQHASAYNTENNTLPQAITSLSELLHSLVCQFSTSYKKYQNTPTTNNYLSALKHIKFLKYKIKATQQQLKIFITQELPALFRLLIDTLIITRTQLILDLINQAQLGSLCKLIKPSWVDSENVIIAVGQSKNHPTIGNQFDALIDYIEALSRNYHYNRFKISASLIVELIILPTVLEGNDNSIKQLFQSTHIHRSLINQTLFGKDLAKQLSQRNLVAYLQTHAYSQYSEEQITKLFPDMVWLIKIMACVEELRCTRFLSLNESINTDLADLTLNIITQLNFNHTIAMEAMNAIFKEPGSLKPYTRTCISSMLTTKLENYSLVQHFDKNNSLLYKIFIYVLVTLTNTDDLLNDKCEILSKSQFCNALANATDLAILDLFNHFISECGPTVCNAQNSQLGLTTVLEKLTSRLNKYQHNLTPHIQLRHQYIQSYGLPTTLAEMLQDNCPQLFENNSAKPTKNFFVLLNSHLAIYMATPQYDHLINPWYMSALFNQYPYVNELLNGALIAKDIDSSLANELKSHVHDQAFLAQILRSLVASTPDLSTKLIAQRHIDTMMLSSDSSDSINALSVLATGIITFIKPILLNVNNSQDPSIIFSCKTIICYLSSINVTDITSNASLKDTLASVLTELAPHSARAPAGFYTHTLTTPENQLQCLHRKLRESYFVSDNTLFSLLGNKFNCRELPSVLESISSSDISRPNDWCLLLNSLIELRVDSEEFNSVHQLLKEKLGNLFIENAQNKLQILCKTFSTVKVNTPDGP